MAARINRPWLKKDKWSNVTIQGARLVAAKVGVRVEVRIAGRWLQIIDWPASFSPVRLEITAGAIKQRQRMKEQAAARTAR
jgi:hypothetical protein